MRNPKKLSHRARGFTLIELMITIAIVGILASIALPSYSNYIDKSKLRTAQSDLMALGVALDNVRQRTLSYTAADYDVATTALTKGKVLTWTPVSEADFTFKLAATANIYTATAVGLAGRLKGCELIITSVGARDVDATAADCTYPLTSWL